MWVRNPAISAEELRSTHCTEQPFAFGRISLRTADSCKFGEEIADRSIQNLARAGQLLCAQTAGASLTFRDFSRIDSEKFSEAFRSDCELPAPETKARPHYPIFRRRFPRHS